MERHHSTELKYACIEYCSYRMDKIEGTSEFENLSEELQKDLITAKKEGNWVTSSNPLELLGKKWTYFRYKMKN